MTFQNSVLQLNLSGVWTSVPLLNEAGVKIVRGHDPYGTWPRPTQIDCRINNDSLNYDPSRPASLIYGVAGRNSKVRMLGGSGGTRVWGEATEWIPDRTPEHVPGTLRGLAWVDLTAYGLLNRLQSWQDPIRSAMYTTISTRPTCIGHWSMEDDRDAQQADASVGAAALTRGIAFGEDDKPKGAKSAARVSATSFLNARFLPASTTAGWQIACTFKLAALPPSATYVGIFSWRCANGNQWYWEANNNSYQYRVTDHTGAALYTGSTLWGSGAEPNQWVTVRLKASQVGGNVQLEPAWYAQDGGAIYGITDTFAGSVSGLQQWFQFGSTGMDQALISHLFAVTGLTDNLLSATAVASFQGYDGELAGNRFFRIMAQYGLPAYMIGAATDTQPMGPQPVDSVLNILKECRDTDDARLDDERFDIGLTFTTRRALYNQTPVLTLSYPSQVAIPFTKLINATPIKNQVTIKNRNGGETTWTETTGPASILPPPAGVGAVPYTQNVSINNEDLQLDPLGSHWLNKLTLSAPRFEEITVDLLANPGLDGIATAVREGSLIRVTGYDYDPLDFVVVGIKEQSGPGAVWTITFQCEPGEFWRIGVYDDGVWRWDARTMTVQGGGLAAGATAITTNVSDPNDVLTTNAGSFPLDMVIGQGDGTGEVVRVTAATAAGAAPTYAQTLTVTRNINSIGVRAWPANTAINVHDYRRWGL